MCSNTMALTLNTVTHLPVLCLTHFGFYSVGAHTDVVTLLLHTARQQRHLGATKHKEFSLSLYLQTNWNR